MGLTWGEAADVESYTILGRHGAEDTWQVVVQNIDASLTSAVVGSLPPEVSELGVAASGPDGTGPVREADIVVAKDELGSSFEPGQLLLALPGATVEVDLQPELLPGGPLQESLRIGDETVGPATVFPGPPAHFTCSVVPTTGGTVTFQVAWAPPVNAEEAGLSHHLVEVRPEGGEEDEVASEEERASAAFRVAAPYPQAAVRLSSVPRGRRYTVAIMPVGAAGSGPPSCARVSVPAEAPQVPEGACASAGCSPMPVVAPPVSVVEQHGTSFGSIVPSSGEDEAVPAQHGGIMLQPVQGLQAAAEAGRGAAARHGPMVRASWQPPANDGIEADDEEGSVQHYRVAVYSGGLMGYLAGGGQLLFSTRVAAPATEVFLSGFMSGSEYTIAVAPGSVHCEGAEAAIAYIAEPPPFSAAAPQEGGAGGEAEEEDAGSSLSAAQQGFRRAMRERWEDPAAGYLGIRLRRASLFEESVAILGAPNAARDYLQAHLEVEFEGEVGVDAGGLLREWVTLVVQEGCRLERGLFMQLDEGGYLWPSAVAWHVDPEEAAIVFRFLGRVVGLALVSGHTAGFMIHPIFWQWALAAEGSGEEVDYFLALRHFDRAQFLQRARLVYSHAQLATALGLNCTEALAAVLPEWRPLEEAEVEALELTWDYEEEVCGALRSSELRRGAEAGRGAHATGTFSWPLSRGPHGHLEPPPPAAAVVRKADAPEYLRLWARHRIIGSAEAQLEELRQGILEVAPEAELAALTVAELEELVVGVGWSADDLLPHIDVVVVREAESPSRDGAALLFQWLAEVLHEFTGTQREAFLQYVTGAARLPAGGAAALRPKLTLQVIPSLSIDSLPVVHTCANLIDIPLYPDLGTLRERLLTALRFGNEGFGLM